MNTRPERTIAVLIPAWPVLAAGVDPQQPAATVDKQCISSYNTPAGARGVRRGQRVRDAQSLCPELEVHRTEPDREARAFEPIVLALESAAVGIEIVRPGLCLLRAEPPARYYGSELKAATVLRAAVAEVKADIPSNPVTCAIGIADGSFTAVLAARLNAATLTRAHSGQDEAPAATSATRRPDSQPGKIVESGSSPAFLAPYPVAALERPALAGLLKRLGIHTLGAFAALPVVDVANRFGADGLVVHRLARGLDSHPPVPRHPAEDLSVVHEFNPPSERDEPVVFAGKALADQFHTRLATAGLSCQRLQIEITTEAGRQSVRTWRHGDEVGRSVTSSAVANMVRWQLDSWRTQEAVAARAPRCLNQPCHTDPQPTGECAAAASGRCLMRHTDSGEQLDGWRTRTARSAPPAESRSSVADLAPDPLVSLRLVPGPLVVDSGSQQVLWGRETVPDRVGRAAERVQALLGHDGVTLLHEVGGRDPAARIAHAPWGEPLAPDPAADPDAPWPGAVPDPAPPLLPTEQNPVLLLDARGEHIGVDGRVWLTGPPALLVLADARLAITAWAGPWPYYERPWRPVDSRRVARLQLSTADGRAFLLALEHGSWHVEGVYQ
jgi:protein ImuB